MKSPPNARPNTRSLHLTYGHFPQAHPATGVPGGVSSNEPGKGWVQVAYLPRRMSDVVNDLSGREVSGRHPVPGDVKRAVNRGAALQRGRGIVRSAQVRAVEYVAEEALQAVGRLSRTEAFYARQVPHATARLQAIADLAAMNLADIVAETGRE